MKNKKLLILSVVGIIVLLIIISLIIRQVNLKKRITINTDNQTSGDQVSNFKPDFLGAEEKKALNIPDDSRVQALKRNSQGEVMVYKIIRTDSDITDPAKVGPISPRLK